MAGPGGTINLTNGDDFFPQFGVDDNSGNETVNGLGGADTIFGGLGNDTLKGGADDDFITDFEGTSIVADGGDGDDYIELGGSTLVSGTLDGGTGRDQLFLEDDFGLQGFTLSGFEVLGTFNGTRVSGTAAQLESFERFAVVSQGFGDTILLRISATGAAQTADFADELGGLGVFLSTSDDSEIITTGAGDDIFGGGGGDDTLNSGDGSDFFYSGAGNDVLNGGDQFDTASYANVFGGGVNVSLAIAGPQAIGAGHGSDTLIDIEGLEGSNQDDVLTGNASYNQLNGGQGDDTLDGGADDDAAVYFYASGGVTVDLRVAGAQAVGADQGTDTLINIEDLYGSDFNDVLTGNGGDNYIHGWNGFDVIRGEGGNDIIVDSSFNGSADIDGGSGNDIVFGSFYGASGIVSGGADTDILSLGTSSEDISTVTLTEFEILEIGFYGVLGTAAQFDAFNIIRRDASNPSSSVKLMLASIGAPQTLNLSDELTNGGGPRGVEIDGSSDRDVITTAAGADVLDGRGGNDVLRGLGGNDVITDNSGTSTSIDGGDGDDKAFIGATFTSGVVAGGNGNDTLEASTLAGLTVSGFEILHVGDDFVATAAQYESFDVIRRDEINTTARIELTLAATGLPQTLDLADELNSGGGPRAVLLEGSFENDTVTTGDGDDTILGYDGNDTLNGGAGDDLLNGGYGHDVLNGNDGNDRLVDVVGSVESMDGGAGDDVVDLVFPTSGSSLFGGAGQDTLIVGSFANLNNVSISGFEILETSIGPVTATAAQFELFDTIRKFDTDLTGEVFLVLSAIGGGQVLDISSELAGGSGPRAATVDGSNDNERVVTGARNDTISGNGGNDALLGGLGNDKLNGEDGNDRLDGGAGKDVLNGDQGNDVIVGGTGGDRGIGGDGNDRIGGGDGDDVLIAGAGSDRLDGGGGNDRLFGGSDNDVLLGGSGSDMFSFSNEMEGNDRIDDWVASDDQIGVDASAFGGGLAAGALAANRLVVSAAPVADQAFGQFLFNSATGQLSWDADGTGAGAGVALARLFNGGVAVATLTVADFDIVA